MSADCPGCWPTPKLPITRIPAHPCGHTQRVTGCGGCDPGAIESVITDDGQARPFDPDQDTQPRIVVDPDLRLCACDHIALDHDQGDYTCLIGKCPCQRWTPHAN